MSKLEREVKILDVDPEAVEAKLQELGAKLVSKATQKIYVYDLTDLSSRFADCIHGLKSCKFDYQYEVIRDKLRGILLEIDNLTNSEQQEQIKGKYDKDSLVSLLESTPSDKLLEVFGEEGLAEFIDGFEINPQKWIRLRETNGKTTLTVKHILNPEMQDKEQGDFQPVLETEIPVRSLEDTNNLLQQLGFVYRNYQEKKRTTYSLNGVEVDIDSWPLIPPYVEIEDDSMETIHSIANSLGLGNKEMVSCNTQDVYRKYGIDIYKYRTLAFDEDLKQEKDDDSREEL